MDILWDHFKMENQQAYLTGESLSKAAQLFKAGKTAFGSIAEVSSDSVLFKEMSESARQYGTLRGKDVRAPSWVEQLVLLTTFIGEPAGIYDIAWVKASELLLPTQQATDAARVTATLIDLGIKADAHNLINPCLPPTPLPVRRK